MSDPGNPPQVPPDPHESQPSWSAEPPPAPAGQPGSAGGPPAEAFAGFWIRFAGALIDGILLGVVTNVLGSLLGLGLTNRNGFTFVLGAAYFTYFHASGAAQTIGQKAVNIRIADVETAGTIDYGRAFLRFIMSYVSGLALLIGYLWMLWDPQKQTWHDKVARTYVVRTSHYPPPGEFGKPANS